MMSLILASATVPVLWVIGVVLIVAGVVYMFRRRMLLGVVLLIVGILLGGLNIFGALRLAGRGRVGSHLSGTDPSSHEARRCGGPHDLGGPGGRRRPGLTVLAPIGLAWLGWALQ